jgi:hypothetical protein
MSEIMAATFDELISIVKHFLRSVNEQLLCPSKPKSWEEQCLSRIKSLQAAIREKDGQIAFLQTKVRDLEDNNRNMQQLLTHKDKELDEYRRKAHSLEWQLRNGSH